MSEKMTNILGYATLFAILGAIWVMFGEDPTLEQGGRGEPTFGGLAERINETANLRLSGRGETVTLKKIKTGWSVDERSGYAADTEKVSAVLRGMAVSERREPKTANKDRFADLGIGKEGLVITLADDTGGELRRFQMGKRTGTPDGRSLTYMYQATDTRAWLVTGLAEAEADPAWWLDKELLSVEESRVNSVALSGVTLTRALGEKDFQVADLKDGEKAAASWKLAEPARTVAGLSVEDVKHVANPLQEPVGKVTLSSHDGLTLALTLYDIGESTWAQIAASFSADVLDAGDAGELPEAPENGAEEAAHINDMTHGWLFKLSANDATILNRTRADFAEKVSE